MEVFISLNFLTMFYVFTAKKSSKNLNFFAFLLDIQIRSVHKSIYGNVRKNKPSKNLEGGQVQFFLFLSSTGPFLEGNYWEVFSGLQKPCFVVFSYEASTQDELIWVAFLIRVTDLLLQEGSYMRASGLTKSQKKKSRIVFWADSGFCSPTGFVS